LDETIRQEIRASLSPLPADGGARHRFFVLLKEQASTWATRAKNAYMDCLKEIGREPSASIHQAVWQEKQFSCSGKH
jgi:hypothetical protein